MARAMAVQRIKIAPTEAQVLAAVMAALSYHPMVGKVWRQNIGAGKLTRGSGASQFIRFGFAGCPDIHGYMKDGRALYCEVKSSSGKVTAEQAEFIFNARQAGCVAFVARSVECVFKGLA